MGDDSLKDARKSIKVSLKNWRWLMERSWKHNKSIDEVITELRELQK